MKKYRLAALILLLSTLFVSCVKDNTVNNFRALDKIEINGIESVYEVMLGDYLKITPDIKTSHGEASNLRYIWYIYSTMSASKRDTLSTEKNLNIIMTGSKTIPGIEYTLVYRITDNNENVFESKSTKLFSLSEYTKGTLLLCEEAGQKELNFMLGDADNTILHKVYELNNGKKLDNSINQVAFSNPNNIVTAMKHVYLLGENEDGGYALDPITLATSRPMREMFDNPIPRQVINVSGYSTKAGNIDYVILDNKLSKRTVNMSNVQFQPEPLVVFSPKGNYYISDYLTYEHQIAFYDELNGRILRHLPWNKGALLTPNPEKSTATHFDPNNMGNYMLISCGKLAATDYWVLGKERTTGQFTIFKFNLSIEQPDQTAAFNVVKTLDKVDVTPAIAPNLANAIGFAANKNNNSGAYKVCFYAVGSKVYALNMDRATSGTTDIAESLQIDLSDENMTITGIEFPTIDVPAPTETNPLATRKANQIRIYVQDNKLSTLKGGVIYYEITTTGGITATEVFRKIGGYCDKVIDVEEKLS